jgi:hypothetical protein
MTSLDRRAFTKRCAALLSVCALPTAAPDFVLRAKADQNTGGRKVRFSGGQIVPALGQVLHVWARDDVRRRLRRKRYAKALGSA